MTPFSFSFFFLPFPFTCSKFAILRRRKLWTIGQRIDLVDYVASSFSYKIFLRWRFCFFSKEKHVIFLGCPYPYHFICEVRNVAFFSAIYISSTYQLINYFWYWQVKQNCRIFAENASERLNLLVKAFCEEDNTSALALISQSKSMAVTGTKLLPSITSKQVSKYPFLNFWFFIDTY